MKRHTAIVDVPFERYRISNSVQFMAFLYVSPICMRYDCAAHEAPRESYPWCEREHDTWWWSVWRRSTWCRDYSPWISHNCGPHSSAWSTYVAPWCRKRTSALQRERKRDARRTEQVSKESRVGYCDYIALFIVCSLDQLILIVLFYLSLLNCVPYKLNVLIS